MKKLHDSILDVLEENDFSVCSIDEQNGETVAELEWYSPAGEDVIVTIWFDGSDADFIRSFRDYADDFDAEEHAAMWVNSRGKTAFPIQSVTCWTMQMPSTGNLWRSPGIWKVSNFNKP